MYSKLLKHEWRSTRGMLGILCLICLGAALAGGGTMRYLVWSSDHGGDSNLLTVVNVLALVASIFTIFICGVAGMFLYIWRFYKSRFTDEGFLTFTLPVTTHQNLLSAIVNTVIGTVLLWLAIFLCFPLLLLIGFSGVEDFFPTLWELLPQLPQLFSEVFRQEEMKFVWIVLLNAILGSLQGLILLMLSVTVGSVIAKKHKILAAVGCYYGIGLVISFFTSIGMGIAAMSENSGSDAAFGVFGASAIVSLAVAVGGYFLMYYLADRKLNLT